MTDTTINELCAEVNAQSGTQDTKRFQVYTAADALEPQPPIDWVIEPLFPAGSTALVVGEPGCKKTYAMLDAAICVATGANWLDFTTKQGGVLFVDEESGPRRLMRRLGDCLRGHFADKETPMFCTSLATFSATNPEDVLAIESLILQTSARLVVLDALADFAIGLDENSVKEMQPVFRDLRGVAERTQSAIVLIHHTNKAGSYRGSTSMKGSIDVLLTVESKPQSSNIDFQTEKTRDEKQLTFSAFANFSPEQFWLTASTADKAPKFSKSQNFVLQFLWEKGVSETTAIMAAADVCSGNAARQAVYNLVSLGFVERTDSGASTQKASYGLTQKGKLVLDKFGTGLSCLNPLKGGF